MTLPTSTDVSRLLVEAGRTEDHAEQQRLVRAAEEARHAVYAAHEASKQTELGAKIVAERMQPVQTHSLITTASDWMHGLDTEVPAAEVNAHIVTQASLWYDRTSPDVKADYDEFAEQAKGVARHISGQFGKQAAAAFQSFVEETDGMRQQDLRAGNIPPTHSHTAAAEQGMPGDGMPNYSTALSLEATTSERAPQIQELEANNGSGASQDVVPVNDPGLGQTDNSADLANGDEGTQRDGSNMINQQRSASRHQAYSGLDQVQQTVDPSDTHLQPTPLPEEVAFPWDLGNDPVQQTIQQTEQQIGERDQRKGASKRATAVARQAYEAAMKEAGYDASGWMGDMGAGGYVPNSPPPGEGGHNLGAPDPVYGYGGDQGNRPGTGIGASELDDETNIPSQWSEGQPAQADVGQSSVSPGLRTDAALHDPQIKAAEKFIEQRKAWLRDPRNA
jgi:hypothetical protein